LKYVALADEVWHAGDIEIGCDRCFKKSERFMVTSMTEARMEFPLHNRFMCEGVVWITHGGYPGKYNPAINWKWLQINYLFVDIHTF
jgi:hypothetical protein